MTFKRLIAKSTYTAPATEIKMRASATADVFMMLCWQLIPSNVSAPIYIYIFRSQRNLFFGRLNVHTVF
jgi:hypothetical protein